MTTRIWALAIAMMALCIPMISIDPELGAIPVLVILSTGISTVVIWRGSRRRSDDNAQLVQAIYELQHQLARLQISSTDDELRRKIEELQSQ